MLKHEKIEAINAAAVGYWSALGGLELKEIIGSDYAVVVSRAWTSGKKAHKVIIHYESERPYIVIEGCRYHFDDCLRV